MIVKREVHITTRKEDNNFMQMERNVIFIIWETVMCMYIVVCTYKSGGQNKGRHFFKVMEM